MSFSLGNLATFAANPIAGAAQYLIQNNPFASQQTQAPTSSPSSGGATPVYQGNPTPTTTPSGPKNFNPYNPGNYSSPGVLKSAPSAPAPRAGAQAPTLANNYNGNNGDLVSALMAHGYNQTDATNIANGSDASRLRQEYLGGANSPNYEDQINAAFGDVNGVLDQMTQNANNSLPALQQAYTGQYDAQLPVLAQQNQQALQANQTQQGNVQQQGQNALASARNLFNDLNTRRQQLYGGGSSAGEFANDFLGRQQLQQQGQIQQTTGQNSQALVDRKNALNDQYNSQVQSLTQLKNAALGQAQLAFQNILQQIDQNRLQTASAKAQAKLGALQDLRTQAMGIQSAIAQQALQLQSQTDQANLSLRNALTGYQAMAGQPVNMQNYSLNSPNIGGQTTADPGSLNFIGQYTGNDPRKYLGYS